MKLRWFIALSLTANLALASVALHLVRNRLSSAVEDPATPVAVVTGQTVESMPEFRVPDGGPGLNLSFRWSQIIADDLKVYRDNLRAIGCPEPTVRDIILAEINDRFGQRRQNLLASLQGRFWELVLRGEISGQRIAARTDWVQQLTALGEERQKVIDDVLGKGGQTTAEALEEHRKNFLLEHAWLPPEKRDQLFALEQQRLQSIEAWAASFSQRSDPVPTAADDARLQEIQQQFEKSSKELLTSEELEELRLRDSSAADWAKATPGFEPTEDEWRAMTRARSEFDAAQAALATDTDLSDVWREARQNELQTRFDQNAMNILGPDRYAQFELAGNAQFQEVRAITDRYGMSDDVAAQAYDIQQNARAQRDQSVNDPNLSPDERQQALAALRQETQVRLAQTLGEKAFSTYLEYGGAWLTELGQN